ncbi:hypothetical protein OG897_35485 [Streptomyces sp. NBC_00237]|uniref:hypothetical protein n=1 Tax=Streptomyces sp. NBC_00237 TaxID=2975687 RepID=UPI00224E7C39|nr:hypothetical protein [Streptomyces sp. NBC_00237]MCX5206694.1 hypothetical protein [Streptomyces sp. NBC_00237]
MFRKKFTLNARQEQHLVTRLIGRAVAAQDGDHLAVIENTGQLFFLWRATAPDARSHVLLSSAWQARTAGWHMMRDQRERFAAELSNYAAQWVYENSGTEEGFASTPYASTLADALARDYDDITVSWATAITLAAWGLRTSRGSL